MAVNDIVGLRIVGRYQGQNIVNTLHFMITAQTVSEHQILQLLTEAWDGDITGLWYARHIDTYTLVGLKMFSLSGENKRPGILDVDVNGGVVGVEVPSCVCRTITLYTDSTNYRRRGRVMLSGCDTVMFNDDDGGVTSAERTALDPLVDALLDPIAVDDEAMTPVLPPSGELLVEPITAALARRTPSLIRSRRVKGFTIG